MGGAVGVTHWEDGARGAAPVRSRPEARPPAALSARSPRSPTTTGKIERLHQTLQQELLNVHAPFASIEDAQAAVDAWRKEYNAERPQQSLAMAYPAARFTPPPVTFSACGHLPN
jgi:transposase InsO family protein